jgi:fido (protein-threonine AMPylation protein)/predicted transcriptional regulator
MLNNKEVEIIEFVKNNGPSSSKEIFISLKDSQSYATLKRILVRLVAECYLSSQGLGKATRYSISPAYQIIQPIDIHAYFEKEIDERKIIESFNFEVISDLLARNTVFTNNELQTLNNLQREFAKRISQLSDNEYKKEFERLAIDLSWKSSQIEGNTYSLLETERLLKERETAAGKTKEEASMLLNHKETLDFILENPNYLHPLSVSKIEDIHSILIKDLEVDRNLRKRRVGISGTNYKPLDNEFQIQEALQMTCDLINRKTTAFEKAMLALVLISYIQPFMDGNKRTARIVSNAILINENFCPLSFRTVDSIDYKKAMLLFYEQNNLSSFKEIFIKQYKFAVETYF